jgi:hypothetical protein
MPRFKKGSAAAKAYMAKLRSKKIGSTLYLEKNEKTTDPIKKAYRIERDAKGRIKKYTTADIENTIVYKVKQEPKEKFFYKFVFTDQGKGEFIKHKVLEKIEKEGIILFRTTGDRDYTESKSGMAWPSRMFNLKDQKKQFLLGLEGEFRKEFQTYGQIIEPLLKRQGISPLYR